MCVTMNIDVEATRFVGIVLSIRQLRSARDGPLVIRGLIERNDIRPILANRRFVYMSTGALYIRSGNFALDGLVVLDCDGAASRGSRLNRGNFLIAAQLHIDFARR